GRGAQGKARPPEPESGVGAVEARRPATAVHERAIRGRVEQPHVEARFPVGGSCARAAREQRKAGGAATPRQEDSERTPRSRRVRSMRAVAQARPAPQHEVPSSAAVRALTVPSNWSEFGQTPQFRQGPDSSRRGYYSVRSARALSNPRRQRDYGSPATKRPEAQPPVPRPGDPQRHRLSKRVSRCDLQAGRLECRAVESTGRDRPFDVRSVDFGSGPPAATLAPVDASARVRPGTSRLGPLSTEPRR